MKKYIQPVTNVIVINARQTLLAGSIASLSDEVYTGDQLSREFEMEEFEEGEDDFDLTEGTDSFE